MKNIISQVFIGISFNLIFILCLSAPTQARKTLILSDKQSNYPLGMYLEILEDPTGDLSINDVTSTEYETRFMPCQEKAPNFGYTKSAYWVRFRVRNETKANIEQWRLALGFANMHYVDLYKPYLDGQGFNVIRTGMMRPMEKRDVPFHRFVFKLSLPIQTEQIIFLRFKNEASMTLPLTLWSMEAFNQQSLSELFSLGLFIGILIIMIIYNIFIFFSLRDKSYLYYFLFVFTFLMFVLSQRGLAYQYLWPNLIWWNHLTVPLFSGLLLISLLIFTDNFLLLKARLYRLHQLINVLLAILVILIILIPFISYGIIIQPIALLSAFIPFIVLLAGFRSWRQGYRPAQYFLLGIVIAIITGIINAMTRFGLFPSNFFTEYGVLFGIVLLVGLLSLALADRINLLKAEKEKTYQELCESEKKYRTLLDNIPQKIFQKDINSVYIACNNNLASDFNITPEQIAGKTDYDLVSKELADKYRVDDKRIMDSGTTEIIEDEYLLPDGQKSVVETVKTVIRDDAGQITGLLGIFMDITGRKKAEEKYYNLVEQANDGIAIFQDEIIRHVNRSMAKMLGYTVDEMINTHISEYSKSEENPKLLDRHRRRQAGEDNESIFELELRHRDGHYIHVESIIGITEFEDIPAVLVFVRDITDRKQLESELLAKERLLNFAIEQLPIPVVIANAPDVDISLLNQAAMDLMVKPLGDYRELPLVEHRGFWPSFHPDGTPYTIEELPLVRAIREGHITRNEEIIIRPNDEDRWVSGNAAPLKDKNGKIIAAICAFPDITELKRADEAIIRQKEEETRALTIAKEQKELLEWMNTFDTFVAKNDPDGNILFCNEAVLRGTGVTEEEVYGKYFPDMAFWTHSEIERSRIVECFKKAKKGIPSRIETSFRGPDGNHVPVIFNCQPVMNEKGDVKYITAEGKIIIEQVHLRTELQKERENLEVRVRERTKELEDLNIELSKEIAERTKAEMELARYRDQLEDLVEKRTEELQNAQQKLLTAERLAVLGQLSGSISHEIRNPLSVIDSSAYYLNNKLQNTKPKVQQHLDRIRKSVKKSTSIIESLLNLTKMEIPRRKLIDVIKVLNNTVSAMNIPNGINMIINISAEKIIINADYEQLSMAFKNIITNAVDAMEENGTLKIQMVINHENHFVKITFEDTGKGIEPKNTTKIFQPLFSTKVTGIGFGLSICQQIVEKHEGTIEAISELGKGTNMIIQLPLDNTNMRDDTSGN